jgi:hypothetical protein
VVGSRSLDDSQDLPGQALYRSDPGHQAQVQGRADPVPQLGFAVARRRQPGQQVRLGDAGTERDVVHQVGQRPGLGGAATAARLSPRAEVEPCGGARSLEEILVGYAST